MKNERSTQNTPTHLSPIFSRRMISQHPALAKPHKLEIYLGLEDLPIFAACSTGAVTMPLVSVIAAIARS